MWAHTFKTTMFYEISSFQNLVLQKYAISDQSYNRENATLTVTQPNILHPNQSLLDVLILEIEYFRKEFCLHVLEIS